MNRLARLAQLLGLNTIPVVGVSLADWSSATALVLYWCETLMLVVLVALRIELHRRATHKRGHYCEIRTTTTSGSSRRSDSRIGYFGTSFLALGLAFSAGQFVFLGVALRRSELSALVNLQQLRTGLLAAAVLMLCGLGLDLIGLGRRRFAWIRDMSGAVLWRVFLVQIVIIVGVVGQKSLGLPRSALLTFVGLKLYTDVAAQVRPYDPEEAPRWMVRLLGPGFASYWRTARQDDEARLAAEEEPFDGRPIPFESTMIRRSAG